MVRWHHQHNGHDVEQTPGDGGRPESGVPQAMEPQRAGHNLATEQQHVRNSQMEEMPWARCGGGRARLPCPLWGHHSQQPHVFSNLEALRTSEFRNFYGGFII